MAYSLKAGVSGLVQPQLATALDVAGLVYASFGYNLVVTSLAEGEHMAGSLHPRGYAADLRTSELSAGQAPAILAALKSQLGPDYDVVLESDHIHVEYDPQHNGGANLPDFSPSAFPPVFDSGGLVPGAGDGLDPGAVFAPAGDAGGSGLVLLSGVPTGVYVAVGAMLFGLVAVSLFGRD